MLSCVTCYGTSSRHSEQKARAESVVRKHQQDKKIAKTQPRPKLPRGEWGVPQRNAVDHTPHLWNKRDRTAPRCICSTPPTTELSPSWSPCTRCATVTPETDGDTEQTNPSGKQENQPGVSNASPPS